MRRMSVSANTAIRCTTCIDFVYKLYSKVMLLTERRRFTTLWSSVMSVDFTLLCAVERFGQSCEKIQKVFISSDMEKYSTCPRNKVFA